MLANCFAHGHEAGIRERMELSGASADQDNGLIVLTYHVVSEEHPAEEKRPTRARGTVTVRQKTSLDTVAGSYGLTDDTVIPLVTTSGQYGISEKNNVLDAMLKSLVNKAIGKKLGPVVFENRLLRKTADVILSPQHFTRITETVSDKKDFVTPVSVFVKNEKSKRLCMSNRKKRIEAPDTYGAPFGQFRVCYIKRQAPRFISDQWTNKKAYSERSEKAEPELVICKELKDGRNSRQ